MNLCRIIEKYFWVFLVLGSLSGLVLPIKGYFLMEFLKPALMVMLLSVFLKTDVIQVFRKIKNYRLILFLVLMYMTVIPALFFLIIQPFNQQFAIGILLLVSMPTAVAAPVLTDIVKGNIELTTSIVIATSLVAPLSVPALFSLLDIATISVNPWEMLVDLSVIILIPILLSQVIKKYFWKSIERRRHLFSSINVILLSLMVFSVMGANREVLFSYSPIIIMMKLVIAYAVFILLHVFGYLIGFREKHSDRISVAVGAAYMNNGMAIVLAAMYFGPEVLVFTVLSEFPWNTMLAPFKFVIKHSTRKTAVQAIK